jgi:hypothetical protein
MSWIKSLFRKKNTMQESESLQELEKTYQDKDFQWLKGDNMGTIERYKGIVLDPSQNKTFINFQSGGRIDVQLVREFMDIFPTQRVAIQENTAPKIPQIASPAVAENPNSSGKNKNVVTQVNLENSPIYTLLQKQKPNWVNVNISLKLNLPTKTLYNVLSSSFEDAEKEVVNFVIEGLEIDDIKQALADSILSYYDKKKGPTLNEKTYQEINDGE